MLVDYDVFMILFVVFLFMTVVAAVLWIMIIDLERRIERLEAKLHE